MTIRMLTAFNGLSADQIVTLDSGVESAYIANGFAVADLDGPKVYPILADDGLVLPKTSGKGLKVDQDAPTFGWRDIIGQLYTRGAGAQDPTWAVYNGAVYQYQFATADEVTMAFHLPHDYVPGTDIHAHVHYSLKTGVVETLVWEFTSVYAKGFNQEAFTATPVVTSVSQATPVTTFQHMIAETPISSAAGSAGVLFANTLFEVDGLVLVRVKLLSNSGAQSPFVHSVDLHYQSTNMATKGKAPSFYA